MRHSKLIILCAYLAITLSDLASAESDAKPQFGKRRYSSYIVGGSQAERGKNPWVVSLLYDGEYHCAGTILNPTTILTAGHCIVEGFKVQVRAGDHILSKRDSSEQRRNVEEMVQHPNYEDNFADIGIIKLEEELEFNEYVHSIPLANLNNEDDIIDINDCKVAGYGDVDSPDEVRPWALQEAPANLISRGYCRRLNVKFGVLPPYMVTQKQICTKDVDAGACYGDSGAPLVCKNDRDKPVVLGLVSWGAEDCWDGYNVYTRVAKYRRWIREYLD